MSFGLGCGIGRPPGPGVRRLPFAPLFPPKYHSSLTAPNNARVCYRRALPSLGQTLPQPAFKCKWLVGPVFLHLLHLHLEPNLTREWLGCTKGKPSPLTITVCPQNLEGYLVQVMLGMLPNPDLDVQGCLGELAGGSTFLVIC